MGDALGVRRGQGLGDLDAGLDHQLERHRLAADGVSQVSALQVLHGDEGQALVLVDLVDRADVGMAERRGGARLAHEALDRLAILRH